MTCLVRLAFYRKPLWHRRYSVEGFFRRQQMPLLAFGWDLVHCVMVDVGISDGVIGLIHGDVGVGVPLRLRLRDRH